MSTLTTPRTKSHKELILAWMQEGNRITDLEALQQFGCRRLGARIWDLKKDGISISTRMVKTPDGAHVAEYSLAAPEPADCPNPDAHAAGIDGQACPHCAHLPS